MEDNFINSLRSALSASGYGAGDYDRARNSEERQKYIDVNNELQREYDQNEFDERFTRRNRQGLSALFGGTSVAGLAGGPAGVLGATIPSLIGIGLNHAGGKDATSKYISDRDDILKRQQENYIAQMRNEKLDAIDQLMGTSDGEGASILAENGMMVLDDGTIENIDYDYYRPFVEEGEDMSDIFGTRGWRSVRDKILGRK